MILLTSWVVSVACAEPKSLSTLMGRSHLMILLQNHFQHYATNRRVLCLPCVVAHALQAFPNMKNCFSPVPLNDAFCPTPANKNMKLRKAHFHFMMAVLPRLPTRTKQIIKWVFHFMMTILPRLPSKNKQIIKWNSVAEKIKYIF